MDGWTTLGDAAARVVEGARSRMEEKSDERAQWSASALVAVACDPEGSGAGREDRRQSQGVECHAACPSERGGTSRTVTPSRVFATNDAARASERARASSSGKRA